MTIKYKIIKTAQPGVKGGGEYKFYPRISNRRRVEINDLARTISEKCSMRKSDVIAVLTEMTEEIPKMLLDNCSIRLGDLGIFSLHASGNPSGSETEVNETKITRLRVAFRPGKEITDQLKLAKFSKKM